MKSAIKWDALIAAAIALLGWAFTAGALYQEQQIILREVQEIKEELRQHESRDLERHDRDRARHASPDSLRDHAASH